jgi:hypothetical protein
MIGTPNNPPTKNADLFVVKMTCQKPGISWLVFQIKVSADFGSVKCGWQMLNDAETVSAKQLQPAALFVLPPPWAQWPPGYEFDPVTHSRSNGMASKE